MNGKLHLYYKILPKTEGFTTDDFTALDKELTSESNAANSGAADALLIVSIMKSLDGGRSYSFPSLDGTTGEEILPNDVFKIWAALAHSLSECEQLGYGPRELCRRVHLIVKDVVAEATGIIPNTEDKQNG